VYNLPALLGSSVRMVNHRIHGPHTTLQVLQVRSQTAQRGVFEHLHEWDVLSQVGANAPNELGRGQGRTSAIEEVLVDAELLPNEIPRLRHQPALQLVSWRRRRKLGSWRWVRKCLAVHLSVRTERQSIEHDNVLWQHVRGKHPS
jgi:hypothetical protein